MFREALCAGGDAHHVFRTGAIVDMDVENLRGAKRESAGLVEHYGVNGTQHLEIQPALYDGPFAGGTANRAQDGKRGSCGNATSSRDHGHRYDGPRVTPNPKR